MYIDKLNNFYQEFSYGQNNFNLLMQFYQDLGDMLVDLIQQTTSSVVIPDVGTYYHVPYQCIPISEGYYDVRKLLSDIDVLDFIQYQFGIELYNSIMDDRIAVWNNSSKDFKVSVLEYKKHYIYLNTAKEGSNDITNYPIVTLDVENTSGEQLLRRVDYELKDNKIYLLKNLSNFSCEKSRLILKDIAIDYNDPEHFIGNRVYTKYTDSLTKDEYRDIVQALLHVGLGGPIVNSLDITLNELLQESRMQIIDMTNATGAYQDFWDINSRHENVLSPFEYLVLMPPEITSDKNILDIIIPYLQKIKLSRTNFSISPDVNCSEMLKISTTPENVELLCDKTISDIFSLNENVSQIMKLDIGDIAKQIIANNLYDDIQHYDENERYDGFNSEIKDACRYCELVDLQLIPK